MCNEFSAVFHTALSTKGGEKFTADDVTDALRDEASAYARAYAGTFGFMLDMQAKARRGPLSAAQAKGVLNCMAAAHRRTNGGPKPWEHALDGDTAPFPGAYAFNKVTVKVEPSKKFPNSMTVRFVRGVTGRWDAFSWAGFVRDGVYNSAKGMAGSDSADIHAVLKVLWADDEAPKAAARAKFATDTGKCSHCRKVVKDDASKAVGLGESVCQGKYEDFLAKRDAGEAVDHDEANLICGTCGVCMCCTSCDPDAHGRVTCRGCGKTGDETFCDDCVERVQSAAYSTSATDPSDDGIVECELCGAPTSDGECYPNCAEAAAAARSPQETSEPMTREERRAAARAAHSAAQAQRLARPDDWEARR